MRATAASIACGLALVSATAALSQPKPGGISEETIRQMQELDVLRPKQDASPGQPPAPESAPAAGTAGAPETPRSPEVPRKRELLVPTVTVYCGTSTCEEAATKFCRDLGYRKARAMAQQAKPGGQAGVVCFDP